VIGRMRWIRAST